MVTTLEQLGEKISELETVCQNVVGCIAVLGILTAIVVFFALHQWTKSIADREQKEADETLKKNIAEAIEDYFNEK